MKSMCLSFIFIPLLLFSDDIAIIGDSISAGYGVEKNESYSNILRLKLGLSVNNVAFNFGSTRQIDEFIFKVFSFDSPKILILALGTADVGYYQTPPSVIHKNFEKIIETALNRDTKVFLGKVELCQRFDNLSIEYKNEFNNIYIAIKEKYPSVSFFDFMSGDLFLNPQYTLDFTHPNAMGHKIIAEVLESLIREFFYIKWTSSETLISLVPNYQLQQ